MLVIPYHRSTEPLKTLQLLILEPKITEYGKTNKQKNPLQNWQIRRRLYRTSSQGVHILPFSCATAGSHLSGRKTPATFHSALLCTRLRFKGINEQEVWGNLRWSTNFLQRIRTSKDVLDIRTAYNVISDAEEVQKECIGTFITDYKLSRS